MIKKWFLTTTWLTLGLVALPSKADDHDKFKEAERFAWSGNFKAFQASLSELDHPLSPYVEMAFYKRHPHLRYQKQIEHFLSVYQHTPLE